MFCFYGIVLKNGPVIDSIVWNPILMASIPKKYNT